MELSFDEWVDSYVGRALTPEEKCDIPGCKHRDEDASCGRDDFSGWLPMSLHLQVMAKRTFENSSEVRLSFYDN